MCGFYDSLTLCGHRRHEFCDSLRFCDAHVANPQALRTPVGHHQCCAILRLCDVPCHKLSRVSSSANAHRWIFTTASSSGYAATLKSSIVSRSATSLGATLMNCWDVSGPAPPRGEFVERLRLGAPLPVNLPTVSGFANPPSEIRRPSQALRISPLRFVDSLKLCEPNQ